MPHNDLHSRLCTNTFALMEPMRSHKLGWVFSSKIPLTSRRFFYFFYPFMLSWALFSPNVFFWLLSCEFPHESCPPGAFCAQCATLLQAWTEMTFQCWRREEGLTPIHAPPPSSHHFLTVPLSLHRPLFFHPPLVFMGKTPPFPPPYGLLKYHSLPPTPHHSMILKVAATC